MKKYAPPVVRTKVSVSLGKRETTYVMMHASLRGGGTTGVIVTLPGLRREFALR